MLIRSESITDYHTSGAFGKSSLMDFAKYGAADFYARHIAKTMVREDTPAFRFGRLFDGLTEDEAKERARWAPPLPEDMPNRPSARQRDAKKPSPETVAAIARWDEWLTVHAGKEEVSERERAILNDMLEAMAMNDCARKLWCPCEKQVSIRCRLDGLGISLQSRPDGLHLGSGSYIADIKTCRDIDRFPLDSLAFGYHCQLALGQWLLAKEGYLCDAYLIAVEKKLKPRCRVYRMPEIALAAGWEKCKALADEVARRIAANDWSEPQESAQEMLLPDWTIRRLEEEAV